MLARTGRALGARRGVHEKPKPGSREGSPRPARETSTGCARRRMARGIHCRQAVGGPGEGRVHGEPTHGAVLRRQGGFNRHRRPFGVDFDPALPPGSRLRTPCNPYRRDRSASRRGSPRTRGRTAWRRRALPGPWRNRQGRELTCRRAGRTARTSAVRGPNAPSGDPAARASRRPRHRHVTTDRAPLRSS